MEANNEANEIDFKKLFELGPDAYLLLSPAFVVIGVSDAYLRSTLTNRHEIVGRNLFEVFPDNPGDPMADGVSNLQKSLGLVLQNKVPHKMDGQKYDIRRMDGTFEERYWSPLNTPVLNELNEVSYIIHRVEDVTVMEKLKLIIEEKMCRKEELVKAEQDHVRQLQESEDRFFKIFNLSPVAIYVTDAETGTFLQVNRAFESLFKMKSADVIGRTVIDLQLTDEASRARAMEEIDDRGGRNVDIELDLRISTGEVRNMLVNVEVIEVANRKCFLVAMVDITERRRMEDKVRSTNYFLDAILENIPDMVFVKDAQNLQFVSINKAGEKILGYSREELLGKSDYDFFTKEQADSFTCKDREVFCSTEHVDIEEEPIQTKWGERWLHTKKIPIFENGQPTYLVGISEDITERKKQHDAILELNKELSAFSYSVSHDLRAPLRAVTGYAQILEEDYAPALDAEGKRLLKTISNNAEKMGRLIDELLSFSRLGKKKLDVKDTDMDRLVRNALADVTKSASYTAEVRIGKLHNIQSDIGLMTQVMINLLSNAFKYSSKKDNPQVAVDSELRGKEIIFSVKDNGAGFDMRYAQKLFGVFQRLHGSDEFEGTGVGLAIVSRITKKHGGRVWAEGRVDEGATFYFSIPII